MKPELMMEQVKSEAAKFAQIETAHEEPSLYGVTDGKAIGTYLEHKFVSYLSDHYSFSQGNAASGIDIPSLQVDIKVTSIKQPQSSCPLNQPLKRYSG